MTPNIIFGPEFGEVIIGSEEADYILANEGNDTVRGVSGDDLIDGEPGEDWLHGDQGQDTLLGNQGNDTIFGGLGSAVPVGPLLDRDLIFGNTGNDYLQGNEGNDTVYGGKNDDLIHGGKDDDWLHGDLANDTVFGDLGNDTVYGGPADPVRVLLDGNDLLFGVSGQNLMQGNVGDDTIFGGTEMDVIYGGQGNDLVIGNVSSDIIFGDKGNDTIYGGTGNPDIRDPESHDFILGGDGNDYLHGNEGNDTLVGVSGSNIMRGGQGEDEIYGADCNDLIYGDKGSDTLVGGGGADIFAIGVTTGSPVLEESDHILDFNNGYNLIGLDQGQTLENLNIFQGEGEYAAHAIIQDRTTGEYLAIVHNTDATTLTPNRFTMDLVLNIGCDGDVPPVATLGDGDLRSGEVPAGEPEEPPTIVFEPQPSPIQPPVIPSPEPDPTPDPTPDPNQPPTVTNPLADQTATAGEAFSFTVPEDAFTDAEGDPLTYTATLADGSPLPDWLTFDPATGALSGTPDDGDAGDLEIAVTAEDDQGNTVTDTFALGVDDGIEENQPPTVTNPLADQTATAGEEFSFAVPEDSFTDPEGEPLTFTATLADGSPLPDWLTFDPATGELSGTPDDGDAGDLEIAVTAEDDQGNTVTDTFALGVDEGIGENIRPAVNLNPEEAGVDTTVTFDPEAEGVPIAENSLVTDPDPENNTLTGATVRIANPIDGDAEELIVDTEGTEITATVENGVVNLSGEDDVENYERVLQRIRYNNTAENPDLTPRDIEIVVSDGIDESAPAVATVEFPPAAALEITKTVSDAEATIGEELSYTVTLTNEGGMPATGITVSESLPNWLRDITFTPTEGNSYDPTADEWTIPRLEGGESTTLTISGILARWGTIPNRARVTAFDQGEPDPEVALAESISPLPTPDISLSNMTLGNGGLVIYGENEGDLSGRNVSSAGDVNSDGFNDILIGTRFGDRPDGTADDAGRAYVLFGGPDIGPQIDLRDLNGNNGFAIYGIDADDAIGRAVSNAGDINGDGFDDIMVASRFADGPDNDRENAGESYIIFGGNQFDAPIDLTTLDGTNGFTIFGREAGDQSGRDVHAGDINGDGVDDLLIGAFSADGPNNERPDAGETYVIFGGSNFTFDAEMDLADFELDGTNGFTVFGAQAGERSGRSPRSAGDINGDGYNDLLIGAPQADEDDAEAVGETYLVYGGPAFNPTIDLADIDGTNGVRISGINAGDLSGRALSNAGDINGDGLDDMIIGAQGANNEAGESYVIFGSTNLPANIDLANLDGTNGFTLSGINAGDLSGRSVSNAGDINGDGYDDLIINASLAPGLEGEEEAGQSYVLFGGTTFNASLDLEQIDGTDGFTLYGIEANNRTGRSVSAGDVNGDGFDDVLVGAPEGDVVLNGIRDNAGETYIMYGGDFTGAVTQHGGLGNDSLTGTAEADVIIGAQGDDTLIGAGGPDVIYGGSGNHLITVADSDFRRLEGGSGEDTVRLDGDNFAFDLTEIADNRIHDIEMIDLNGGSNSLNLDPIHVLHLSDRRNRVIVSGEQTNAVTASGNWVSGGTEAIGNDTYNVYIADQAQLWVEDAIAQDGITVIG
jgi:uncharacterized repeat protein (TIGR01451 family)